jgi:hypothetical protein
VSAMQEELDDAEEGLPVSIMWCWLGEDIGEAGMGLGGAGGRWYG